MNFVTELTGNNENFEFKKLVVSLPKILKFGELAKNFTIKRDQLPEKVYALETNINKQKIHSQ